MDSDRYFQHSDLYLCGYLVASKKAQLLTVEWDDNNQAYFIFADPKKCERLRDEYFAHEAKVDPFQMAIALRELKARLYGKQ